MFGRVLPLLVISMQVADPCAAKCTRYQLELRQFNCSSSSLVPNDINVTSVMVGHAFCGAGEEFAVVMWDDGTTVPLNLPANVQSRGIALNSQNQILGWMSTNTQRGFVWTNGQTVDIGNLPTTATPWIYVNDINLVGIAVGQSTVGDGNQAHAFYWHNGNMIDMSLPVGPNHEAMAINAGGHIVGWMGVAPGGNFYSEAFSWQNGNTTILSRPAESQSCSAKAISSSGDLICGFCSLPDPQGPGGVKSRAMAWYNGIRIDLGVLNGFLISGCRDVNDERDIVGVCSNPPLLGNNSKAFIWRGGEMKGIADLLSPEFSEYQVRHAYAINNVGQIAARVRLGTGPVSAALLTPIPPRTGDTNCDWLVNVTDLLNVIQQWGPNALPGPPFEGSADINEDGVVNVADLLLVISNWGS